MTNDNTEFVFFENTTPFDEEQDFVAHVPASICDSRMLLDALFARLLLPGYFGFNWNALSDCLRDLSWIERYRVVVLHHDLPSLGRGDLSIYLDVLRECIRSWKPGEDHQLIVAFPMAVHGEVLSILNERA